jgi:hypothetical protein
MDFIQKSIRFCAVQASCLANNQISGGAAGLARHEKRVNRTVFFALMARPAGWNFLRVSPAGNALAEPKCRLVENQHPVADRGHARPGARSWGPSLLSASD